VIDRSLKLFKANDFSGRTVADPFMGGGTPLLEANRVGCDVQGLISIHGGHGFVREN